MDDGYTNKNAIGVNGKMSYVCHTPKQKDYKKAPLVKRFGTMDDKFYCK